MSLWHFQAVMDGYVAANSAGDDEAEAPSEDEFFALVGDAD